MVKGAHYFWVCAPEDSFQATANFARNMAKKREQDEMVAQSS
jgi:hypothetical protein